MISPSGSPAPTAAPSTRPGAAVAVTATALGVDMFLYGSLVPLLPKLPAVGGSALTAGVLFAVYAVALLGATPFVGAWVDRRGPRSPLLAGLVGLAAATVLFAAAVDASGTGGLTLLLLARAAQGVAAAASWTAGLALVAATHGPDHRGRAMGVTLSAVGVGILLGPAVSGPLVDAFGPHSPFILIAVLAACDAVARLVLVKPVDSGEVRLPYQVLLRGPGAGLLITLTAMGATAIALPEPVLPLHLNHLGMGRTGIGLAFAMAALAGSLAAPVAGALADRSGATRMAAIGAAVTAVGFVLAGRDSMAWSIAGLVVVGVGAQVILAPTLLLVGGLAEHGRPAAYGSVYALYNLAYTGGLVLAPLAAGSVTRATSVAVTTLVAATAAVVLALVLGTRRQPARTSTESPQPIRPGRSTEA
ncbi:MFS transporter [Streptomyces orinoci]|uniref:MFS transporter n=1 Tax=Streptomyces orinoci TaxID=67339 RepID=A0ABV3JQJ9_STRON|nr:MFS transporter [Streptomyces orinoci]